MKLPVNWPADLTVKKATRADPFGGGAEYTAGQSDKVVATVYRAS